MKTIIAIHVIFAGIFLIAENGFAQSAKKFFKAGNEYAQLGNYEMAIEQYTKSIDLDGKFTKAILARAESYEQLSDYKNAAEDYQSFCEISPKEYINGIKAASLFIKVNEYNKSLTAIAMVEPYAPETTEIPSIKAKCYYALEDYSAALEAANKAVRLNGSAENFYLRGLINAEIENYNSAELDFKKSVDLKPDFVEAIVQQAFMQYKQNKQDEALLSLSNAIEKGNNNKKAYLLRASIYSQKSNYKLAINDLIKAIALSPDADLFFRRGEAYLNDQQFIMAIKDFSKVIELDNNNLGAMDKRAECFQKLNRKEDAIKDYQMILSKSENNEKNKELIEHAKLKIKDLNKESNKPKIILLDMHSQEIHDITVAEGIDAIKLKVKIIDENNIAELVINKISVTIDDKLKDNGQVFDVDIHNKSIVEIVATDIYQNATTATYKINRNDEGLPKLALTSPIVSETGFIYLKSFEPEIFIEGRIMGKNLIDSIQINNIPVLFNKMDKNPAFKQKIQVSELDNLTFLIKDDKGNKVQKKYAVDRSDAELLIDNPMGRTWVVFIENTEYSSFTNLEGPKKEVDLMIKALSKYKIDKIIHKKNLTKLQMNSFFSSELKKLVSENRVNSLLIWYAGHGKLVDQNGFWIPVDSKIDDVSTYYDISTLKNIIKPYIQYITHSLIVTDACETGPSFYMSMRSILTERNCSDTKATKSKSSQVFTSSTHDFVDGNSQFTISFANALMSDNNSCVPIERIVNKVSQEVTKTDKKRPIFGRITGFEDENGTFIFIKK
jgi:tetratricopeptide (TPR) repeat protein